MANKNFVVKNGMTVGNSTVNAVVNATSIFIGNSTVNSITTATSISVANSSTNVVANTAGVYLNYGLVSKPIIKEYAVTTNALGNITGATTVNLQLGNYVTATVTGAITWTFSNAPASPNAGGFVLKLINGGSQTQVWPASVKWPSGTAPTLSASGTDVLTFITDDAGTTWRGVASMTDSR